MPRLSTGTYYKQVPKDLDGNRAYRAKLLAECLGSDATRKAALGMCREDVLFFVNSFCWTFRPKAKGGEDRVVPFVTWDGQDEIFQALVDHIDRQVPLVIEKSRDAGASWASIYTADWTWRFHKYVTVGLSSRVGDLVDSKSPDSLFWKLRFVQKWLPAWMWPRGWEARVHDTQFHYENPETGSVVTGHPTTKDIGVAGRTTWFLFDEFSRVPNARPVLDNTKDTSDCRVFLSTHTSPGTEFHKLCTNGVTDKIVVHWSEHPEKKKGMYRYHPDRLPPYDIEIIDKDYPFPPDYTFVRDGTPSGGPHPCLRSVWYDQQCKERTKTDVRTNLDIDVTGSTTQFFDPVLIRKLSGDPERGVAGQMAREPEWVGDVMFDSDGNPKLVEKPDGSLRLWTARDMRGRFRPSRYGIGADVSAGTGATPSCASVVDLVRREKVAEYANSAVIPERFAHVVAAIGNMFRDPANLPAKVCWDRGGAVGSSFGRVFMTVYNHVYYQKKQMAYAGYEAESDSPGWSGSNNETKATMLMEYASALEKWAFINPSYEALNECHQFKWVEGRVEHATERNAADDSAHGASHGDMVVADGLACMLIEDKSNPDGKPPPEPEPALVPGSYLWRRVVGDQADLMREDGEGWKD